MKNTTENILDVTVLEPKMKHPTIFARFDELDGGESLVIHNDHDPKPLYYQMYSERGNIFNWEYLEQGPQWWKVRITRRKSDETQETIAQLVVKDVRSAEIFRKYGIDYGSGGRKTLNEAAAEKGLDVTKIDFELQQLAKTVSSNDKSFGKWDCELLIDYIINTHHAYIRKHLPQIRENATKVLLEHSKDHPELQEIYNHIEELYTELSTNIQKEELIMFPYIREMSAAEKGNTKFEQSPFGSVQQPINMMEIEHEAACYHLKEIRKLTFNYTLPEDACETYASLYKILDEFEHDLQMHTHLENNILYPKTVELEKKLSNI